jgi:purine-binding chemotaxis protein CheW
VGDCLMFELGELRCALPAEYVTEIMRPQPISGLANAPSFVLGLALIRGEAMPVVDLGKLVLGKSANISRFIVIRVADRNMALAVNDVQGLTKLEGGNAEGLSPILTEALDTVQALLTRDQKLLLVLQAIRIAQNIPNSTAAH